MIVKIDANKFIKEIILIVDEDYTSKLISFNELMVALFKSYVSEDEEK